MFNLKHPQHGTVEGVLGLHVDDGICGGTPYFNSVLDKLEQKYPFGTKKMKQFTFTGIEMQQLPDHSIHMSQSKYIRAINPIQIPAERKKSPNAEVTESERQDLRALIGSLQYASVHTRPDLSSRLSNLQSQINKSTVETLIQANQTLHEAKKHHDTTIKIQSIPIADFRFLAFSDASFASKTNPNSHTGMLIMGTHKDIENNVSCPVSPLAWGCKKIQRVVTSTLAAETVSLNSVLDQLSWMRLFWAWINDHTTNWKQPAQTLKSLPNTISTSTYRAQTITDSITATDCKSLYVWFSHQNCDAKLFRVPYSIKRQIHQRLSLRGCLSQVGSQWSTVSRWTYGDNGKCIPSRNTSIWILQTSWWTGGFAWPSNNSKQTEVATLRE